MGWNTEILCTPVRRLDDTRISHITDRASRPLTNIPVRMTEGIWQYDSCDMGQFVNIAVEHQEPAKVLSQLGNTRHPPVYGEYKCC